MIFQGLFQPGLYYGSVTDSVKAELSVLCMGLREMANLYYAPRFCICNLKLIVIIELDEENGCSCHHQAGRAMHPCVCWCMPVRMCVHASGWHSSNLA